MARINIPPTRSSLLRMKQELRFAREGYEILDKKREVLTMDGRTLPQGAIGWIWAKHERTIPIPGFKNEKQVQDNAKALEFGLFSVETMQAIADIVAT